jgi:hypothetical protein
MPLGHQGARAGRGPVGQGTMRATLHLQKDVFPMSIQWFPGHMHLTRKAIAERVKTSTW